MNVRSNTLHLTGLSKKALHVVLTIDSKKWLNDGHTIEQLPPGNARGLSRYESLLDIQKETGLVYEQ